MAFQDMTLGERIVLAARLAAARHLFSAAAGAEKDGNSFDEVNGQQLRIGGAGPVWVATTAHSRPRVLVTN